MAAIAASFLTDPWTPTEIADLDREIAQCERYEERMAYGKRPTDLGYAAALREARDANLRGLARLRKLRGEL